MSENGCFARTAFAAACSVVAVGIGEQRSLTLSRAVLREQIHHSGLGLTNRSHDPVDRAWFLVNLADSQQVENREIRWILLCKSFGLTVDWEVLEVPESIRRGAYLCLSLPWRLAFPP